MSKKKFEETWCFERTNSAGLDISLARKIVMWMGKKSFKIPKGVIWSHQSKDIQYIGRQKGDKKTHNTLADRKGTKRHTIVNWQNSSQKAKYWTVQSHIYINLMQSSACRNFFNFTHIAVNYFAAKNGYLLRKVWRYRKDS